jgi:hypothetical protein
MRAAFNFDWNDALLYQIVLNSARVTVDTCVKTICQLTEHQSSQDDCAPPKLRKGKALNGAVAGSSSHVWRRTETGKSYLGDGFIVTPSPVYALAVAAKASVISA